jgi:hypothetical protein
MNIDNGTSKRLRSMEEVVADLTAELQYLSTTDPRRLKISGMIDVLQERIACRPHSDAHASD